MVLLPMCVMTNIMTGTARGVGAGNAHSSGAPDFTLGFASVRDIRLTIEFTTDFVY